MTAYLIGALAGIVSIVVIAAAAFGGVLAFFLMLIAPLPIAIVSLGWGTNAAFASAVISVGGITYLAGIEAAAVYAVLAALPVALAGYELGLARPASEVTADTQQSELVWFPIGTTLAHIALVIGLGLILLGILSGQTPEQFTAAVEDVLRATFEGGRQPISDEDIATMAALYTQIMPFLVPAVWTILVVFNVWLGGKIVQRSGRLQRPWPDLALAHLPLNYSLVFALALAGALTSGLLGLSARPLAGALFSAYLLIGLGILHVVLRGKPGRSIILPLSYIGIFFLSFPAIIFSALGALEPLLQIRNRVLQRPPKP